MEHLGLKALIWHLRNWLTLTQHLIYLVKFRTHNLKDKFYSSPPFAKHISLCAAAIDGRWKDGSLVSKAFKRGKHPPLKRCPHQIKR